MKKIILLLTIFILAFSAIQPVAAEYNLDRLDVTPAGDLSPGDKVTVECDITLTASSGLTFIANHDLEAYTELENPEWEYQKEQNGQGIWEVSGKKYLTFGGWDLSYPDSNTIEIHYRLEGYAPEISATGKQIIFRLRETDVNGNVVTDGEVLVERTILNPEDVITTRELRVEELAEFRTDINEKYALGVDTTGAEEKYRAADDAIDASKTTGYSEANTFLANADTYLTEGEELLNQAWTTKTINDAQVPIDATETLIVYFKTNRSMGDDSRVLNIETKYNFAQQTLSNAKDLRDQNQYIQARIQADSAKIKGDEAYAQASKLRKDIGEGFSLGNIGFYLMIVVVLVIIGGVGLFFYRRYSSWDELG